MPIENIEQLFCEEYKSLKTENTNLKNHNQQLQQEITNFTNVMKQLKLNEEIINNCSADCLSSLQTLGAKYNLFSAQTMKLLLEAKNRKLTECGQSKSSS